MTVSFATANNQMPQMVAAGGAAPKQNYQTVAQAGGDTVEVSAEQKKGKVSKKQILTTSILLIGGAILGYGHRNYIEKGVNIVKDGVSKFFSSGMPAEALKKGKELMTSLKNVIMSK